MYYLLTHREDAADKNYDYGFHQIRKNSYFISAISTYYIYISNIELN